MTSNKFCSQPPASKKTSASNTTTTKVCWLVTWDCLILNHWHLGTRTERKGSTIFLDIWQVWWKCSMACDPPRQFGEVAWQKFGMFVETKSEVCCLWAPGWPRPQSMAVWKSRKQPVHGCQISRQVQCSVPVDSAYGINLEYIQHYDNEDVCVVVGWSQDSKYSGSSRQFWVMATPGELLGRERSQSAVSHTDRA